MNNVTTSGRRGNTGKILISLGTLAVAGLVAAGGSAFTDANTGVAGTAHAGGYSNATVTGANVTDIAYTYNADFSTVNKVTFTLASDLVGTSPIAQARLAPANAWNPCVYTKDVPATTGEVPTPDVPGTIVCTWSTDNLTSANTNLALVVRDGDTHLTSNPAS